MPSDDIIKKASLKLGQLGAEREELSAKLVLVDAAVQRVETAVAVYNELLEDEYDASESEERIAYAEVEIDFSKCVNLRDRLVAIAKAIEGPLSVREAGLCLIQRDQSKATLRNLETNIIHTLADDPDFEKVGLGLHNYLPKSQNALAEMTLSCSK